MQVFIPYRDPYETAKVLDVRRLNKQVLECRQILAALEGTGRAWANHPVTRMYANDREWLRCYADTLDNYRRGHLRAARMCADLALVLTPVWMNDALCDQHKRRLYTKDAVKYAMFAEYGTNGENWYVLGGEVVRYVDGKRVK